MFDEPVVAVMNNTYPEFISNYQCHDYLKSRTILTSILEMVDQIIDHVLALMSGILMFVYRILYFILVVVSLDF